MYGLYSSYIASGMFHVLRNAVEERENTFNAKNYGFVSDCVRMGWVKLTPVSLRSGTYHVTDLGKKVFLELYNLESLDNLPAYEDEDGWVKLSIRRDRHNGWSCFGDQNDKPHGVILPALSAPHKYDYVVETLEST